VENTQNIQNIVQHQEEESFDYKALFFKLYRYWYFFILTIFIALLIAFLFNKYTKAIYEVSTTVLISSDEGTLDAQQLLGFGGSNNKQNIENEIGKLQSYTLINHTIKELDLRISYFEEDNFVTSELYKNNPFIIEMDSLHPQPVNVKFKLNFQDGNTFSLEAEGKGVKLYDFSEYIMVKNKLDATEVNVSLDTTFAFGKYASNKFFRFKVLVNENYKPDVHDSKSFYFIFNDIGKLTKQFQAFSIEPIKDESSIINITLKANNVKKSIDFLNTLTDVYLSRDLEKKNRVAENTINFIDSQLGEISDSLNFAEENLQNFRTSKQVMNLDHQATLVFEQLKNLENEKAILYLKSKYYKTLKDYINEKRDLDDVLTIPTTLGIEDPLISRLILNLSDLYAEKEEKLYFSTSEGPGIIQVEAAIKSSESTLLENIIYIINTSEISVKDIDKRIAELEKRINTLPATQREFLGIERKFQLSNRMYNYLQEKRSEAQITMASNEPDNEVIDIARDLGDSPVFPKKSLNYMIAIILGVVLPVVYILGKDFFNDNIVERKDVENLTSFPIIGHIIHSAKENQAVVAESPKSSISESFRSIRTNLQFMAKGKEKQTILITSDMVSAGKDCTMLCNSLQSFEKKIGNL